MTGAGAKGFDECNEGDPQAEWADRALHRHRPAPRFAVPDESHGVIALLAKWLPFNLLAEAPSPSEAPFQLEG